MKITSVLAWLNSWLNVCRVKIRTAVLGATIGLTALTMSTAAQAVEIEYWQYFFEARIKAMEVLIDNFQKANPDITVKMSHFPYADYRTKVAAAIPAGEGPDVVQLFYGWLNDYVEAELIQPLPADRFAPADIEKNFFPMVAAMRRGESYMALPTAVRSLALFYNERLFEAAGIDAPPTTHDELIEVAKKLTEKDAAGNITTVGITTGMTAQDHHWIREVLIRQFGGEPYQDDYQTVGYTDGAGKKAFDFYTSLQAEHGVTLSGFMDQPQAAFKAGRAGMHIDGSFRIGALDKTRGLKWGVTELPASNDGIKSNYSSYWVNGVTSKATGEKLEASLKFMEYITSDQAMQIWLDTVGELPAKPSAALTDKNSSDPVFGPFIRGLEYAHTTKFANESAQRQVFVDLVGRVDLEDQPLDDSLTQAAEEEQKILDEYYK